MRYFFRIVSPTDCGNVVVQSKNYDLHYEAVLALYILGYSESNEGVDLFTNGVCLAEIHTADCREPIGLFERNWKFHARVNI